MTADRRWAASPTPSPANPARALPPSTSSAACTACQPGSLAPAISVWTKSMEMSDSRMPRAHMVPGSCGTITIGMPHSSATSTACKGPAPP
ncbi:hypothetical protein G6F24_016690 [Rhizopus arrhizus]|nr:hypothetical protein G6F24_016690 [Rhizopus arrhizus]